MQDFGEYLVEIRDKLEVPLPPRVCGWRVFIGSLLETFCLGAIALFRCEYRSIMILRSGLPKADIDEMVDEFRALKRYPASQEQHAQAREAFDEQIGRRAARLHFELQVWHGAARSGAFLGMLASLLLLSSVVLSGLTASHIWMLRIAVVFIGMQIIAVGVCLKDWHRP